MFNTATTFKSIINIYVCVVGVEHGATSSNLLEYDSYVTYDFKDNRDDT